jgi:hypothetical protein
VKLDYVILVLKSDDLFYFTSMIELLEELPQELLRKLPIELWLLIGKYVVRFTLLDTLQFPVVIYCPRSIQYYSSYWQAFCGDHYWDIESDGPLSTSLIGQAFRSKRIAFCLSGVCFVL